ncbi:F5/8 type C domain-containing protein [Luteibacter rhizovicinus]|uniref:F5/8 type C domain-containing protein n=1 Tax=Luteibacter rhizovicinus TaxID=242606 RepID=A0A4R3YJ70_9GAMM|nr:discoidin domain-containing protein [Luteibacter rhizovicinus]TCV92735.1 F5/8 type C domain-containing protein [Luteibacter rhizovicinus]
MPLPCLRGALPASLRTSLFLSALLIGSHAMASDRDFPARSQWRASSSSQQVPALAPEHAIDGDLTTRWGGAFSAGQWFQVDLGKVTLVGGVIIHWDSGFAASYDIETSTDGRDWHKAYATTDSIGGTEYLFFPDVSARYVRLASVPRTADWGVSVFEFEPLAASDAAKISGLSGKGAQAALWSAGSPQVVGAKGKQKDTRELHVALPRPLPIAGLDVAWAGPHRDARLEARDTAGVWHELASDPGAVGTSSYLAAREPVTATELRLTAGQVDGAPLSVQRLTLLAPPRVMTPMKRYQIAAARAHAELFPSSLHMQQVYWTVVGVPAGMQKSIFDEYGDIEAFKGAPMVQAVWRDASGHAAVADGSERKHALREGWMPMPTVGWTAQPGLAVQSESFAVEQNGQPVTLVRHRLTNTGTQAVDGTVSLVVRPMQVNPPWQNGGPSPIHDIAVEGTNAQTDVRVNGRLLFQSLTPVDTRGAAPFGAHGESEITASVAAGTLPTATTAHDDDGLAAAALGYRVQLAPGAHKDIVMAMPLGTVAFDPKATRLPDAPAVARAALLGTGNNAGANFDVIATRVAADWQKRLGGVGLSLPDHSLVDMLRAQGAYMLINQTGPAMQAGPRNYNRSFIRDGAATSSILLRLGETKAARDYLRWYADHAVHPNGLVSPILNADGTVNTGFGSDIEYDSQGEFINLVADVARLDGGASTVRDYHQKVRLAMQFMQELRERTLVPGYLSGRPAPERFHGIIAPSISHEGYSSPTHSYWDDYWALKGWHDGIWLADQWGDKEMATWARAQYAALRESVAASIRATMAWKGSDFIPSAADLGDGDPTGVSIALDPTGQQDLLPADALERTFTRYLDDVRAREKPDSLYAYTPYEMRNILTYVHLNRPKDANELFDNLMRDRRPLEWQEFAEVVHSRLRHPGYLGDMPHTWIGSEYARALFGMLMREADDGLYLLPGASPNWLAGDGIGIDKLPTAYGALTMTARQQGDTLRLTLGTGLRKDVPVRVFWPNRQRPTKVTVDGRTVSDFDVNGIALKKPFRTLEAVF